MIQKSSKLDKYQGNIKDIDKPTVNYKKTIDNYNDWTSLQLLITYDDYLERSTLS